MRLKAAASSPISSCVETVMALSKRPASTSRVPASNSRTGRVMPLETSSAKANPTTAASNVTMPEMMIA